MLITGFINANVDLAQHKMSTLPSADNKQKGSKEAAGMSVAHLSDD